MKAEQLAELMAAWSDEQMVAQMAALKGGSKAERLVCMKAGMLVPASAE